MKSSSIFGVPWPFIFFRSVLLIHNLYTIKCIDFKSSVSEQLFTFVATTPIKYIKISTPQNSSLLSLCRCLFPATPVTYCPLHYLSTTIWCHNWFCLFVTFIYNVVIWYILFCVWFILLSVVFEIHLCWCTDQWFLHVYCRILFHCMNIPHLLHHLFLYQGVVVSRGFFLLLKAPVYISVQYFLV